MKRLFIPLSCILLSACGADVATTAATAASLKKQELEQGKQTMELVQKKMDASMQQMQQSVQRASDAD
jgi:hypothetical protein